MDGSSLKKLEGLSNPKVIRIVEETISLCKPAKVRVITDDPDDVAYCRELSLKNGEERPLAMAGHTIHFDGVKDLARDVGSTRVLLPTGKVLSKRINSIDRDEGLKEILGFLDGAMAGHEMIVRFLCLGPTNSPFSLPALQITDSGYVAHSEALLYRSGYEEFKRLNGSSRFFTFIHSAGELVNGVTKNVDKRRMYIDLEEDRVLSVNNQYAGNSVGLKKLALRLAINKANTDGDWLAEHMFVMGVHPEGKKRVSYFLGAFPSACGKTSTAMIPGQTIIGDDIAYLRKVDGKPRAVNVEAGIFGIIKDVNPTDDPVIYKTLTSPRELIFSNILIKEGVPFWTGMGKPLPDSGTNFIGDWHAGMKDGNGADIPAAHSNARYTIRLKDLENIDPHMDDPSGVPVDAIIYGARDSDTSVPVYESLSWEHGVFIGASLESETTSATIGAEGVRKHDPMANLDFIVVPLGSYISNHVRFGKSLSAKPRIFATNYFLKDPATGKFFTDKVDKKVWVLWMEGRVHGEYGAITTPIGHIPEFEDIRALFASVFNKDYSKESYVKHFSIRVKHLLDKLDRIEALFKDEPGMPAEFWAELGNQRKRLSDMRAKKGDVVSPFDL